MSQRTRSFGVLALVLWGLGAWAQPTYLLRPHREVPIGISVAGMGAFNLWAAPAVKGFTLAELDALEPRTFLLGTNGPLGGGMKGRATVRTTSFMEQHCGRLRPSSFRR